MSDIKLGDKVRCKASGFTGVATSRLTHINSCDQIGVCPAVDKDNKKGDTLWIDELQLEVVKRGVLKAPKIAGQKTGGPDTKVKFA